MCHTLGCSRPFPSLSTGPLPAHPSLVGRGLRLLAGALVLLTTAAAQPTSPRYRTVILTDMTHDDGNSLIRYLYYSPFFDTEAIIVTPQLPDYRHNAVEPWEKAQRILAAYAEEVAQLRRHDPGFPDPAHLRAVTKPGRGALPILWLTEERTFSGKIGDRDVTTAWGPIVFSDWIGEGTNPHGEPKDSPGSEHLLQVFARADPRPIFVQLWGGPITLVQALYRYQQREGPARFEQLLGQLHIYSIHLQDITTDFFIELDALRGTPCAHLGKTRSSFGGQRSKPRWFLFDFGHFWKYIGALEPSTVQGHGPLSTLYDGGGEGDTPAFLYLVSAALGLNDPLDPTQGSWGNQFHPLGAPYPSGYYHTCPGTSDELTRWLPDANRSFLARLAWSMKAPDEVNHAPVAVVAGEADAVIITRPVEPGQKVTFDAGDSQDPDGDPLSFRWFAQPLPGQKDAPRPPLTETPQFAWVVPEDLREPLHLVLEVRDAGEPSLVSYRRIILIPAASGEPAGVP